MLKKSLQPTNQIDPIFIHPDLDIVSCEYIDWIEIESDHPACAAVLQW